MSALFEVTIIPSTRYAAACAVTKSEAVVVNEPLNSTVNLNDQIGTQHGTNSGAVARADDYDFDTISDYVYFPVNTSALTNKDYSVSFMINLDVLPSVAGRVYKLFFDIEWIGFASFKVDAYISDTNRITVTTRNAAAGTFTTNTGANAVSATGTWYHVLINIPKVGQSADIYINGVAASTGSLDEVVTGTDKATNYRFYLSDYLGAGGIDGKMKKFRVRNKHYTAYEAVYQYNRDL